jgi:phenylalanyl-tRNA synthetase beta chain
VKVLLSWLRDFVDVPGTPEDIAATMSVRGFAVEGIEPYGDGDAVLDFEITANRPDCMAIVGIAREVATAYGLTLRRPAARTSGVTAGPMSAGPALHLASLKAADKADIDIVIENPDLCPRYAGAVADVTVGPSPEWLQARLRACGVRAISNIVDITNYVLLELGQPMHAFDITRLGGGQIRVRTARDGERLRTLDGQERALAPEMLVIADASVPVAVAGVMGGGDSEVHDGTTTIVFESAYFAPRSVRRTSRQLGLKTEASMRFERGTDPRLPVTAMERACALLEITGAGKARGTVVDRYPARIEPVTVRLRRDRITGLLGVRIPDEDVRDLLQSLDFVLRDGAGGSGWDVIVPTRRVDITREVDLIEEVARHYGFDRIPATFPAPTAAAAAIDPRILRARQLRQVMTGAGFSEALTFGFIAEAAAAPFAGSGGLVPIKNPLSDNFGVLRPSPLPGLLDAVAHNRRREQRDVRLFEIGNRFSRHHGENRVLAFAWTGAVGADHWTGGTRDVDFFDAKGAAERICTALGVPAETVPDRVDWLVAGRSAALVAGDRRIGVLGQLAPAIADAHGLPANDAVYVAEIDLDAADALAPRGDAKAEPLPRYPSVVRDISILVADTVAAAEIRRAVRAAAPVTLAHVGEFDRYQGKNIPDGKVSLSLRLTFRSPERTLTDTEVQGAMDEVLAALKQQFAALQR